ncbi:MAG: DNA alkylation repair protein [Candidatus Gastranaerophilales bacterium]|nr:DNA alkylation repair protein [Candidatus Gastranaerophilales bacterium]
MITDKIIKTVKKYSEKDYAVWISTILQIQKGGYGANDKILGVRVPILRKIAREYSSISLEDVEILLKNEYHEIRLLALFILIIRFKNNKSERLYILELYLNSVEYINNWDLVDISAPNILGKYIYDNMDRLDLLDKLSCSSQLWEQRIAIVSTQYLIKNGMYKPTIKLAERFLTHSHHLIHKAAGWMLRELGKRDINELYGFLDRFAARMPGIMLRYAIERLAPEKRKYYLKIKKIIVFGNN